MLVQMRCRQGTGCPCIGAATVTDATYGLRTCLPGGSADTVHPVRRCRERNRAAQKRYRDRQRSRLAEREEQLAELTEKLSLVINEKARWLS